MHPHLRQLALATLMTVTILCTDFVHSQSQSFDECPLPIYTVERRILEGVPPGTSVYSARENYTNPFVYVDTGDAVVSNIFDTHFHYTTRANGGNFSTVGTFDREEMANSLGNTVAPVQFNISVAILDSNTYGVVSCFYLLITVVDEDDNVPTFDVPVYNVTFSDDNHRVNESRPLILATDSDEGDNGTRHYRLHDDLGKFYLEMRSDSEQRITSVHLKNREPLDREEQGLYQLTLIASEGNEYPNTTNLTVNVIVMPICDESPSFLTTQYMPSLRENSTVGTIVVNTTATDTDVGVGGRLTYSINTVRGCETAEDLCVRIPSDYPFTLDTESGVLTLNDELDRERLERYEVVIDAVDSCGRSATAVVAILVEDVNDNAPNVSYTGRNSFQENNVVSQSNIGFINVVDPDLGNNSVVTLTLFENNSNSLVPTNAFEIAEEDQVKGLKLRQQLDRERVSEYHLVIVARDHGTPSLSSSYSFQITVMDSNDNPPVFEPIPSPIFLEEGRPRNYEVVVLNTTDQDIGPNAFVTYELPDANSTFPYQNLFRVENITGRLLVDGDLDREEIQSLSVLAIAHDNPTTVSSGPQMSASIIINITLVDRNDEPPVILSPSGTVRLSEVHSRGNVAELQVRAQDRDTPPHATLSYSLAPTSAPFQIDRTLGTINLTGDLDYDTPPTEYHLTIQVTDGVHNVSSSVTVRVEDVNDEPPIFDRTTIYERSVYENRRPNTFIVTVTATDRDTPQNDLRYSIVSGDDYGRFQIDSPSGNITTTVTLNSEDVISNYTLYIRASDGQLTSPRDAAVHIAVLDENEHAPEFVNTPYNFEVPENNSPSTSVGRVMARDIDRGNNGVVRYRILQGMPTNSLGWFRIHSVSGQIVTTQSLDREASPSEIFLTIEARDLGNQSISDTTVVRVVVTDVNDEPPVFSPNFVVERVNENHAIGNPFFTAQAVDADIDPNNRTVYSLSPSFPRITEQFFINPSTGELSLVVPLDYETENETEFQIVAQDSANARFQSTLTVHIIVIDDPQEPTLCLNISTHYSLSENTMANYHIVTFEVTDKQGNSVDGLVYNVTNDDGTRSRQFGVTERDLQATIYTLTADINREALIEPGAGDPFFRLNITATDTSGFYGSISSTLTIVILDMNDNRPAFRETSYHFMISEDAIVSDFIGQVQATDPDKGQNGTVSYFIRETSVPFQITNAYDGRITLRDILDHETVAEYDFTVVAVDQGTPQSLSSEVRVRVSVTDVNDCSPVFDPRQNRTFVVSENAAVSSVVATLSVNDCDSGSFGQVSVDIAPGHRLDTHFELMSNGQIILRSPLDRENEDFYSSTVRARDGGSPRLETLTTISISVEDYNDNPPVFIDASYTVSIRENHTIGVPFITVTAIDADLGRNSMVLYDLANYSLSRTFCILPMSGAISLCTRPSECYSQGVVDYERQQRYDVQVIAYDMGNPRQFANKTVTVLIENVNEHPPLFDRGAVDVFVDEGRPEGTIVMSLQAYDWDFNPLNYHIDQGDNYFRWENGAVVTNRVLNHNSMPLHILSVIASERDGNLNGTISMEVFVNNINDHAPQFESSSMAETVSEQTGVGMVVLTVHASDADNATNDAVVYSISHRNDNGAFSIDSLSGEISVVSPLDYEAQPEYMLTIVATDTGSPQLTSQALQVTINLMNENDERPLFNASSYMFTLEENSAATVVGRVNATDRDAGDTFGMVRYSMGSNDYFTIDAATGNIRSTGMIDRESLLSNSIMFTVIAADGGQPPLSSTADVTVTILDQNDNPPRFSRDQYLIYVSPTQPTGATIETLSASDLDEPPNNRSIYQMVTQPTGLSVRISSTGALSLDQPIPPNHPSYYNFTVRIVDAQISSMFDSATVWLIVETDTNHSPRFSQLRYTASPVPENTPIAASVFDVSTHVSDVDSGQSGNLSYSFAESYPKFSLNRRTGLITLREMLDFEETKSFNLIVFATDNTPGNPRSASATVTVNVTGYNDNTPSFVNNPPSSLMLSYVPYPSVELFKMEAMDRDEGSDGIVGYFLNDASHLFSIGQESGVVTNTDPLTSVANYTFIVGTFDHGTPSKSSNMTITVCIQGPGVLAPSFVGASSPVQRQVLENLPPDSVIEPLATSPAAQSYHIVYQNSSDGTFSLTDIGLLLTSSLDYEQDTQYQLILEARQVVQNRRYSSYLKVDILVVDDNDNSPQFAPIGIQEIREDASTDIPLFTVTATDEDSGTQGEVHYEIILGNSGRVFSINTATGEVSLAASLDREATEAYDLVIRATDGGTDSRRDVITVHVNVLDVNDFVPTFGNLNSTISVYEYPNTRSSDRIIRVAAIDEDLGPPLTYRLDLVEAKFRSIVRSAPLDSFHIDVDTGEISVGSGINLDRENIDFYLLKVNVSDRDHSTSTFVNVHILDVNEHEPVLQVPTSEVSVWELKPEGTLVTDQIRATDADIGSNAAVLFSLGDGWPSGDLFYINNVTGVIRVQTPFRYSTDLSTIHGTVLATDQGVPHKVGSATITVRVIDVNDHAPQFDQTSYEIPVSIDTEVGTSLFQFNATDDLDHSENRDFMFRIPHYYNDAREFFTLNPDGRLVLNRDQQQGLQGNYTFRIEALNLRPCPPCAPFAQASYADVVVVVYPINRHGPIFSNQSYLAQVDENYFTEMRLIQVSATDADNDDIRYSIISAMNLPFDVDESTGDVRLLSSLDREGQSSYQFTIRAVDTGFPPQTSTALLTIQVLDKNDNHPIFTSTSLLGQVPENSDPNTLVLTVVATDLDEGTSARVTYGLVNQGDAPFQLNSVSGELRTTASIDYEVTPSFSLDVVAMDGGGLQSMATVSVEIIGENEFPPVFEEESYEFTVPPDARLGYSVGTVRAVDGDSGVEGEVIYSLLFLNNEPREYFRIVNTTGEIILNVNPQTDDVQTTENARSRRQTGVANEYFLVETQVQATDSGNMPLRSATVQVDLQLPLTFDLGRGTGPSEQPIAFEIIAISIVVAVLGIIVFVIILITALICRSRKSRKMKINDSTHQTMNNHIELERYSSRNSRTSTPSSQLRHTTYPPPEVTTIISHSGSDSSHSGYADDEMEEEVNRLPHKSGIRSSPRTRSTSDLASTVGTDILTNQSQDGPFHSKTIAAIFARNQELLDSTGSQDSIHMFGSEGGGEADGRGDIDDMLFAKSFDLDDDDDSTTMAEDELDGHYQPGRKSRTTLTDSRSSCNLDIPPVEDQEDDLFRYHHDTKGWIPRAKSFTDTINQMASYTSQEPMAVPRRPPIGYGAYSQGSYYGGDSGSTQDSRVLLLRHPHKQYDSDRQLHTPPEYYGHYPDPRDSRHPRHLPRAHNRYGSATALMPEPHPLEYARDHLPPRTVHYSQEMHHQYNHNYARSHFIPSIQNTPPSISTPSDDGTVTPHRALASDYDQTYLSSSSTSLGSTNVRDGMFAPP